MPEDITMTYPSDYPEFERCDSCGRTVGALTPYQNLLLCKGCLSVAVEQDTLQRLPNTAWE
jgi:hypothetical protein